MLLSLMMRSHEARSRAAANAAALSTRSNCRTNPARLSSSARSSASASESSTSNRRSGLLIGPYLMKRARSEHVCDSRDRLSAMAYRAALLRFATALDVERAKYGGSGARLVGLDDVLPRPRQPGFHPGHVPPPPRPQQGQRAPGPAL